MTARKIGYWVTTVLFALALTGSGVGDLVQAPQIAEGLAALGYPAHIMALLGVWKVLGALAILVPRAPRLKEWAYAGFAFELTGAAYAHIATGIGGPQAAIFLLLLGAASWALRPADRMFGTILPAPAAAPKVALA